MTEHEEIDAYDREAWHVLALCQGAPVGTARLLRQSNQRVKLGRMAVRRQFRSIGVGGLIVAFVEQEAIAQGACCLELDAQCQAMGFYQKLAYVAFGDGFLDAGIEHIRMSKQLDGQSVSS